MKTIAVAASILAFGILTADAQDKQQDKQQVQKEEIISPQPGTVPHQCWDVSTSKIRDKDTLPSEPSTVGSTKGSNDSPPIATRTRPSGMPAC
ncbi:MAG: hypothetical protein A4S14_01955 [Proteobacteria bacterium SG_bin9]|nr:MAG: hypothetical protein A4S14_01955 [Proteobacteria bacterium SG_bin9]